MPTVNPGTSISVVGSDSSILASDSIAINNSRSLLLVDLVFISAGTQTPLFQMSARGIVSRGLISVAPEGWIVRSLNLPHSLLLFHTQTVEKNQSFHRK